MSRIGQTPIPLPNGVTATLEPTRIVVKGPKGTLERPLTRFTDVKQEGDSIIVTRPSDSRRHRSMHGLTRSLIANMVEGVSAGFTKRLRVVGNGYRAAVQGKTLQLTVGYSHPVNFPIPDGIAVEVEAPETLRVGGSTVQHIPIALSGIDKEFLGETAAEIRRIKKPETYEPSKGIRYEGEAVRNMAKKARV